ncbi:DUF6245 family protein, partial [Streptosporangium algeriense]
MTFSPPAPEGASVHQLAAALTALDAYSGDNSPAEHDDEAARLGGAGPYRMRLANALLGAVQIEAILAESLAGDADALFAAHRQQLIAAGVDDEAGKLAEFLRWQTVRVAGPL